MLHGTLVFFLFPCPDNNKEQYFLPLCSPRLPGTACCVKIIVPVDIPGFYGGSSACPPFKTPGEFRAVNGRTRRWYAEREPADRSTVSGVPETGGLRVLRKNPLRRAFRVPGKNEDAFSTRGTGFNHNTWGRGLPVDQIPHVPAW